MPPLSVRIKKKRDGSAALSCVRADGSVTWQRQEGTRGVFFPVHDLTHFAVETELGLRQAFYGLVADGWDLSDFEPPWPRGPLPADAGHAELIVGFFDTDRAGGTRSSAADFNAGAASYVRARGGTPPSPLTDLALARIRLRLGELLARWRAIEPGGTLELVFDP